MLKIEEIKDLINLINDSNISDFVYENEGAKVEIKKIVLKFKQSQL